MKASEKTKYLRKYEGEPIVCAREGDPAMEFYSPFGPMIAKVPFPPALMERINAHADSLVRPGVSAEFVLPENLVFTPEGASLAVHVAHLVSRYVTRVEYTKVKGVRFEVFWIVSQCAGAPSPVHFHSGDVSGVLYLKTPEIENPAEEEAKNYILGREAGYINFLIGGRQRLARSVMSFKPEAGDFYLFPGWLLHGAEPFRGTGERRSMSFNAYLEVEE